MAEPLEPTVGMGVLHLFGKPTATFDREALRMACDTVVAEGGLLVPVAVLGHKADIALMALHTDTVRLRRFQTAVRLAGVDVVDSYVSLTEVSEYAAAAGVPENMIRLRLHPKRLPPAPKAWSRSPHTLSPRMPGLARLSKPAASPSPQSARERRRSLATTWIPSPVATWARSRRVS